MGYLFIMTNICNIYVDLKGYFRLFLKNIKSGNSDIRGLLYTIFYKGIDGC